MSISLYRIFKLNIKLELSFIIDYIDQVDLDIHEKLEELEKNYNNAIKNAEGDIDDIEFYFGDEFHKYNHTSRSLAYNSFIIMIYSLLEHSLIRICEIYKYRNTHAVDIGSLLGKDNIGKCKTYIESKIGISLADQTVHWQKIRKYQNIRNAIIHNDSRVIGTGNKINTRLKSIISNEPRIELNKNSNEFRIKELSFVKEFLQSTKDFLYAVIDKIES
jgi:hypothetical protein